MAIKDIWKSHVKARSHQKRKFYSRSISLTIEQIEWLKWAPVNASQLLRWLIEGVMTAHSFLQVAQKCSEIIRLEKRIAYLELRLKRNEKINRETYEMLKKKRMEIIAWLIQPTSD